MKKYRLLRVIEYTGDIEWIRWQMQQSFQEKIVPASLGRNFPYPGGSHRGGVIRCSTIGTVPELISSDDYIKEEDL